MSKVWREIADPAGIARLESMARNGVLSAQLGDVVLINEAMTGDRSIDKGIEGVVAFMLVNQPKHVDYYCFQRPEAPANEPVPVILIADQTIVQTWPNLGSFLDWVSCQ